MSKEQEFLIKYGIHNFVKCEQMGTNVMFKISKNQRETMIDHAKKLIQSGYGQNIEIRVM